MLTQTLEDGRRLFDQDGLVDYIESFLSDMAQEFENNTVAMATAIYTSKWLRDTNFDESTNLDELLALYTMLFGDNITEDGEYFYAEAPEEVAVGPAGRYTIPEDRRLRPLGDLSEAPVPRPID